MFLQNKIYKNILPKAATFTLAATLLFSACTNEQGESRRALGTGDEMKDYELTEGNDSTVSGKAVTGASNANQAAKEATLPESNVTEKMDTSEAYSSVNGRTSTSNTGASVSNGNTTGGLRSGKQLNQTPAQGSDQTSTGQSVNMNSGQVNQQSVNETRNRGAEDPNGNTNTPGSGSAQPRTNRRPNQ